MWEISREKCMRYHDNKDGVQDHTASFMETKARMEYKITNRVFEKYKARLCAMGNQQIAGIHLDELDLYALVLTVKSAKVRLFAAIAAQHGAQV